MEHINHSVIGPSVLKNIQQQAQALVDAGVVSDALTKILKLIQDSIDNGGKNWPVIAADAVDVIGSLIDSVQSEHAKG